MHSITHFVVAMSILLGLGTPLLQAIIFSFVFAVLVDLDILVGRWIGKPRHHSRTWVQEPFGVLLLGIPLGLIAQQFLTNGFLLVVIPYASHIILDYLSLHEVSPFAPFSQRIAHVGWVRPFRMKTGPGPSEWVVLIPTAALLLVLVVL